MDFIAELRQLLKRSKDRQKECMSDTSDTSEMSLKKEGQNHSTEENSNSGSEQELTGIAGTKEESPAPDYRKPLESPSQVLH